MCHFIILRWLNYIRNILSLIKPAIGSTWDKTDYKSREWKHRARNASVSTLHVCMCEIVHACVPESTGKRRKRERLQEEMAQLRSVGLILSIDGAAAVKLCASLQSTQPLCFNVYPLRDGLSITGLVLGLMDAIHMLFCTASDRWYTQSP